MKSTENTPIDSSLNAAYAAIERQPIIVKSALTQAENRINRTQFFCYTLILFVITTLVYMLADMLIPNLSPEDLKNFGL